MRASPIALAVPFGGHYHDKNRYEEQYEAHARPVVLLKLALTHDAHHLIECVIPVAV
jgi:hypothetical protein